VRSQLQALLEQGDLQEPKQFGTGAACGYCGRDRRAASHASPGFRLLSKAEAIEVCEYLDSSVQQALIENLSVLDIVDKMSPDDRARLFDELPAKIVSRLLEQLSPAERRYRPAFGL